MSVYQKLPWSLVLPIPCTLLLSLLAYMPAQAANDLWPIGSNDIALQADTSAAAESGDNWFSGAESQFEVKPRIEAELMMSAHSPAQPIREFLHDWQAPLDAGDYAYAQGRSSISVMPKANSRLSYGIGWRYDYLMQFSEETAETYWRYANQQPPSTSERYPLFLEAKHNERVGANIGFTQVLTPNWQLTTKANIWQGLHIVDGVIEGTLVTQPQLMTEQQPLRDSIATLDATIDYAYDKPQLGEENLGWQPDKPNGYGYSMDVGLSGQWGDHTQFRVQAYDVLGRMHWQDVASTQYRLGYDVNGRPLYNLEGQLDRQDSRQTLPWRVETSLKHSLGDLGDNDNWVFGVDAQANQIQALYQLSATYNLHNNAVPVALTGLFEPQTQALGVALNSQYGGIKLLTDAIAPNKAKRGEISLYGQYVW